MPIYEHPQGTRGHAVSVRPSMAIELEWLLHSALRADFRADHPALQAFYDEHPVLLEAVSELWPAVDRARCAQYTELLLLAHHGRLLFGDDAGPLLDALPDLCLTVPTTAEDFPLRTETEADRQAALDRVARLRISTETRDHYVDVVRRVWTSASETFERYGRTAVGDTVAAKEAMAAKGAGWRELTKGSYDFGEAAERAVAQLPPDGEVVVVPAYFAHVSLLYDLPGVVVLGIRADESGQATRERNEALARQLRAISDPTRLAIVDLLCTRPRTITELATRFGLAQPTVSNHVKLLRSAGVVSDAREGGRRNLVVHREVGEALVKELTHLFGRSPETAERGH